MDARAVGRVRVRGEQGDVSGLCGRAQHEHFGLEARYPARGEVHHGHNLPARELLRAVELGDLRAGLAHAEFSEVDPQLVGRIAGLGEGLRAQHGAHADVHLKEILGGDAFERFGRFHFSLHLAWMTGCFGHGTQLPGGQARTAPPGGFLPLAQPLAVLAAVAVLLFIPALTGLLSFAENRRLGQTARQRALLGGSLAAGLARAFGNAVWTLWLTVLVLPLGRLMGFDCSGRGGEKLPPVILVHGLYHNPAAWFVMRLRLRRAGFTDVRCYGYASFGCAFTDISVGLAELLLAVARERRDGRVLLMGHSLGGLVIRAACADARVSGAAGVAGGAGAAGVEVAGVVTLGTPHQGSTLAGMLGMGRLARGLAPEGEVLRLLRAMPVPRAPWLSLYTPTDGMVLPLAGALLGADEHSAGWVERPLPAMSHVGLLYSTAAARQALAFLQDCAAARHAAGHARAADGGGAAGPEG